MKICHNRSKKKHFQGRPLADIDRLEQAWNKRKGHVLAWSLSLFSLLALAPTAQAQTATALDWGDGTAGEAVGFAQGTETNTYTDVGGSGVDVRVSVVGAVTNSPNPNLNLGDSDFVGPTPPNQTLLLPLSGVAGAETTVTIEFFLTGTTTPVDVTLASFPIHDLDILVNNGTVSWQDEVVISATSGGAPVTGVTAGGETPPTGIFNQEVVGPNSVTITGVAPGDDPNAPTQNANSPRQPGVNNNTTTGTFTEGDAIVNFANPLDTISLLFRNGPGTQDFASHAISIGDIAFTAPALTPTTPVIGVAKQVSSGPTETAPGSGIFDITYSIVVENLGNEALNSVQLVESFTDPTLTPPGPTFGPGNIISSSIGAITPVGGASLTANPAYNVSATGPVDANLLAAGSTLPIGASATIPVTVQVDSTQPDFPADGGDGFNNQVTASGIGATSGNPVNDLSDDGVDPDPDADGNPGGPNEGDPTPVTFPAEAPAIGVSKRVISAITQPDGDFEVVYETTVENLGNVTLNNVQLTEDLNDTYGPGAFSIIGAPTFAARNVANEVPLTPNPGFDAGDAAPVDINILAAGQTLQVGQNSTFQFTVEVESTLVTTPGTFFNQIDAVGTSPGGTTVDDASDNGVETDADPNDGNPGGGPTENDPTPIILPPTPVIGVAKQVVSTVLEPSGSFGGNTARVTYSIVVANIGTVPLVQVQLDEELDTVYGAGTFQVASLTFTAGATTVAADPGFDGTAGGNTTLLADAAGTATGTLAVGATSTFELVVDVDTSNPNLTPALPGPYDNQISATAADAAGNPTSDLSDSGTDVDPDNDGDPNEGGPGDPDNPTNDGSDNTVTRVRFSPDVRLVKRITRVTRNGVELAIPNIGSFNDQTGDVNDNTLSTLSGSTLPLGLPNITDALQSGDLVEYTIYFFNAGLGTAENLEMCDELQAPSVLQPASLELAQPIALSTGGTTLNFSNIGALSPRAPLSPLEPSCISAPGSFPSGTPVGGLGVGAGGGVVVGGPASGLNVDSNEVGAFRFEVEIP